MKLIRPFFLLSLLLGFAASPLFAGSITNDSPVSVEISGQTVSGILDSLTLQPGQTMMLRQPYLWLQHVVRDNASQPINIKIVEDDGTMGLIQAPGERYTFANHPTSVPSNPDDSMISSKPVPQTGLASNNSDVEVLLTFTHKDTTSNQVELLAGQTVDIPPDTVTVKVENLGPNLGDEVVSVIIVMPDGRQHMIQSLDSTVEVSPEYRE